MLTAATCSRRTTSGTPATGGLAGPMGLLIILLLATATVLLIRNMNARLRRLPDRFPSRTGPTTRPGADATVVDPTDRTDRS